MSVVVEGVTYYVMPAFLVVNSSGTPVPGATSTSLLTPEGDSVTLLQAGTLAPLADLEANADGVVQAYLASAPQITAAFGSVALVQTTSEVASLAANSGIRGYVGNVGDGSATAFIVAHGLGTTDVAVQVYRVSTGESVICPIVRSNANQVTIGFGDVPIAPSSMRVLIHTIPSTTTVLEA